MGANIATMYPMKATRVTSVTGPRDTNRAPVADSPTPRAGSTEMCSARLGRTRSSAAAVGPTRFASPPAEGSGASRGSPSRMLLTVTMPEGGPRVEALVDPSSNDTQIALAREAARARRLAAMNSRGPAKSSARARLGLRWNIIAIRKEEDSSEGKI